VESARVLERNLCFGDIRFADISKSGFLRDVYRSRGAAKTCDPKTEATQKACDPRDYGWLRSRIAFWVSGPSTCPRAAVS